MDGGELEVLGDGRDLEYSDVRLESSWVMVEVKEAVSGGSLKLPGRRQSHRIKIEGARLSEIQIKYE